MKISKIKNILTKGKLSGYEVGRLMMQDLLYELKQVQDEHIEDLEELLSIQEVNHLQDQLVDNYDIQIYNSCRRLLEYIIKVTDLAAILSRDIEISSLNIYALIMNEVKNKAQVDLADISTATLFLSKLQRFKGLMKQWLVLEATIIVISERMELPDLMLLTRETPVNIVEAINGMIKDLRGQYPESRISKALVQNEIENYTSGDKAHKNLDIIDINELKPTVRNIEYAKATIQDLRYFKDGNSIFHTIIEGKI